MAEKCCWVKGEFKQMSCKLAEADGGPVSSVALLGQLGRSGGVSIHSGLIHSHYLQRVQGSWGLLVLLTTEAKVAVSTLAFSVSSLSRSSAPLSCGAYFSLVFLLLMISLLNLFCCPSPSLYIQLHLGFVFLNPTCACLDVASPQVACSCFHLLYAAFSCLVRGSLFMLPCHLCLLFCV